MSIILIKSRLKFKSCVIFVKNIDTQKMTYERLKSYIIDLHFFILSEKIFCTKSLSVI